MKFQTKDSGNHKEFASGGRRDSEEGKPRFDLLWTKAQPYEDQILTRFAMLMGRGAGKYEPRNWEKFYTQEELDRAHSGLLRHVHQLVTGETDEDHAAAVMANVMFIEHIKWKMNKLSELEDTVQEVIVEDRTCCEENPPCAWCGRPVEVSDERLCWDCSEEEQDEY